MKKLIYILAIIFTCIPVHGAMISGGVEYTATDARLELQNNRPSCADFILYGNNYIDTKRDENISVLLKGITKLKDRTLAQFSDNSYGIIYNNDPMHVWYYSNDGTLIYAEEKASLKYPYRTYKYTPDGELVNMTMRVSENETFIFDTLGKLLGHWVDNKCYDESGAVVMERKINR